MNSVNVKSIKEKAFSSKKVEKTSEKIGEKILEKAKKTFLSEFDNHPVTKEILAGPEGSNISGSLRGKGNLFSFIGFESNSSPIEVLRKFLEESFSVKKKGSSKDRIQYQISGPNINKIKSQTPMPWESGRSWVHGIEKGISGFSFYLFKKFKGSRSGTGLQSKSEVNSLSFKPTKYLSKIIDNFTKNIKNKL
jgi:hypothetical protein